MTLPTLSDVPEIGLGTWQNSDPQQCERSVEKALEIGYRHIDTAQLYDNEEAVGKGIASASVEREDVFLASKVSFENLQSEQVLESTHGSLRSLATDYVDLMYVHWPAKQYEAQSTLSALKELQDDDKIRFIGVSNYTIPLLEGAREVLGDNIYAHQVEMHPLLQQEHLRNDALDNNLCLVAYSPFRHGTIFDNSILKDIAGEQNATVAQVCLAWLNQHELVYPIPKATGPDHLEENFEALDLTLEKDQVRRINAIERVDRYIDPPFAPDWDLK